MCWTKNILIEAVLLIFATQLVAASGDLSTPGAILVPASSTLENTAITETTETTEITNDEAQDTTEIDEVSTIMEQSEQEHGGSANTIETIPSINQEETTATTTLQTNITTTNGLNTTNTTIVGLKAEKVVRETQSVRIVHSLPSWVICIIATAVLTIIILGSLLLVEKKKNRRFLKNEQNLRHDGMYGENDSLKVDYELGDRNMVSENLNV